MSRWVISIDVVFMNVTFYIALYDLLPLANPRGNLTWFWDKSQFVAKNRDAEGG